MKFNCGLSADEKRQQEIERSENWHRWFAWKPIRVGSRDCRWLEWIERKGTSDHLEDDRRIERETKGEMKGWRVELWGFQWKWEYRPLQTVVRPALPEIDHGPRRW